MAGTGFFSDIPRIQTFGLGAATQVSRITVTWPTGATQVVGPLPIDQRHDVVEPASVRVQSSPSWRK